MVTYLLTYLLSYPQSRDAIASKNIRISLTLFDGGVKEHPYFYKVLGSSKWP